jgi:uncharacterized protein (DUF1697 family)
MAVFRVAGAHDACVAAFAYDASMKRHIALLRGINVGTAKRVAMADLREMMQALGYGNVRTLLNSGNAVFDARGGTPAGHAGRLKAGLLQHCGVEAEVIVKTAADIAAAIAEHPLKRLADNDSLLLVLFAQEPTALATLRALQEKDWSPEAFAVGAHAAWLWCPGGSAKSVLAAAAGKALGPIGTTRNWATLLKLDALAKVD